MREELSTAVGDILKQSYGLSDVSIEWGKPQDAAHGDLATPVALSLAKELKKAPKEIADAIAEGLGNHGLIEKVEVAGAGYVNVWLTPAALLEGLDETRKACVPVAKRSNEDPVIVEYSQPNIAKPLGAHHLLTTIFGQVISNLYEHHGIPVIRWNYMGDWGTQFGKLAVGVEKWGTKKSAKDYSVDELLELYVQFHHEADKDKDLEDQARAAFKKMEDGDAQLRSFWEDVVFVTKAALTDVYERMHVHFDLDLSESFYEDKMEGPIQEGKEKGLFKEGKEGALIIEFSEESKLPPYMILKNDGATLYSTRDIAQMRYRMDTYHPRKILIVTDIAQQLHFEQLAETCRLLGWELPYFENVLVGRMRYADKSMSTRRGNVLKLEEVLSEAVERAHQKIKDHAEDIQTDDADALAEMMGVGSVAYSIVSQNRRMDIVFDWAKMLSFDGNSAPYLQYTHARARSVLRKAEVEEPAMPSVDALSDHERALLNMLQQFAGVLEESRESHMPHILCNYLFSLCQSFNAFYNADPILKADEPQKGLRLYLTHTTATVLKTGAELLTLRVPERM